MSFSPVIYVTEATHANQDDAQYAANIHNHATKSDRAVVEAHDGLFVVAIDGGYLAWEWFVVRRQATMAISPGKYRVSINRCAPGFSQADADATAARDGNALGYAVSYETYCEAKGTGLCGHSTNADVYNSYTVEPWVNPIDGSPSY